MATLTCKQCNFVNEGERVYCHNCGAKLDRSLLPAENANQPTLQAERRRVKRIVSPNRGFFSGYLKTAFSALASAAVAASLIQMVRPPDGVPPIATGEQLLDIPQVPFVIEEAMRNPAPQRLAFPVDVINGYLANTIRAKSTRALAEEIRFVRAFVKCSPGAIHITSEQSVFGYSLYATTIRHLAIQKEALVATNLGGMIGRLPIHPAITEFSGFIFTKLWDALSREQKLVAESQAIEIGEGFVALTTKPAQ
jgi:hypothetical protein